MIPAADIGDGNSVVSGEATPGTAPLRAASESTLDEMFLIDQPEPSAHPARFESSATVGVEGGTQPPRDVHLTAATLFSPRRRTFLKS